MHSSEKSEPPIRCMIHYSTYCYKSTSVKLQLISSNSKCIFLKVTSCLFHVRCILLEKYELDLQGMANIK